MLALVHPALRTDATAWTLSAPAAAPPLIDITGYRPRRTAVAAEVQTA
ncbi:MULTISPECIES: hypothetical protein [Actinomyces]|nr:MULTISPECIES: hypothetical protein [Actinomyces]